MYGRVTGTTSGPLIEGATMADKSPRQSMTKKSGKSLKEKRASKREDSSSNTTDDVFKSKKR